MGMFSRLFPGGMWGDAANEKTTTKKVTRATGLTSPVDRGRGGRAPVSRGRVTGSRPVDGGRRKTAKRGLF